MGASSPFNLWRESFISLWPQKVSGAPSCLPSWLKFLKIDRRQASIRLARISIFLQTGTIDIEDTKKQDPMIDPVFKEPNIDNLVEIKRKELKNHIRSKRDREAAEARAADRIAKINVR